jgi:glucose-1-phosphate thymidylyltransferase
VKAIVLATDRQVPEPWPNLGLSTRHLAPVANKPLLIHHIEELSAAGIGEILIVCDRRSNGAIRTAVGDGSAWNVELRYLEAAPYENVLSSSAVAAFAGVAPVLVQPGDILLDEDLNALRDQFADDRLDALVMHAGRWSAPLPDPAGPIDCYLFGSEAVSHLRRHSAPLPSALASLRAGGARIKERRVEACLPCEGGVDALLAANRRQLEAMPPASVGERIFGSEIHGRVALDPSAEVRDSVIRGPVAIGPGARILNSYLGPYTSIGPGVVVDCAEIEHSIVLDDARIERVPSRVESSIIGPGARLTHDFRVPRALRVAVGAGAQVSLA